MINDNGVGVPGEVSLIGFDDVLVSRYVRPDDHHSVSDRHHGDTGGGTGVSAGGNALRQSNSRNI